MTEIFAEDGRRYPVSPGTADKLTNIFGPEWPSLVRARTVIIALQRLSEGVIALEFDRKLKWNSWMIGASRSDMLYAASHVRRLHNLTDEDFVSAIHAGLSACDEIVNINSALRYLRGRDFRELFSYLDQVHGNSWEMLCGCKLSVLFDHHRRSEDNNVLHPHYPHKTCKRHRQILDQAGWLAHHQAVLADARAVTASLTRRAALGVVSIFGNKAQEKLLRIIGIRTDTIDLDRAA